MRAKSVISILLIFAIIASSASAYAILQTQNEKNVKTDSVIKIKEGFKLKPANQEGVFTAQAELILDGVRRLRVAGTVCPRILHIQFGPLIRPQGQKGIIGRPGSGRFLLAGDLLTVLRIPVSDSRQKEGVRELQLEIGPDSRLFHF